MWILMIRACNSFPNEAATIPFPRDEITPPVTKMYLVFVTINLLYIFNEDKDSKFIENLLSQFLIFQKPDDIFHSFYLSR